MRKIRLSMLMLVGGLGIAACGAEDQNLAEALIGDDVDVQNTADQDEVASGDIGESIEEPGEEESLLSALNDSLDSSMGEAQEALPTGLSNNPPTRNAWDEAHKTTRRVRNQPVFSYSVDLENAAKAVGCTDMKSKAGINLYRHLDLGRWIYASDAIQESGRRLREQRT